MAKHISTNKIQKNNKENYKQKTTKEKTSKNSEDLLIVVDKKNKIIGYKPKTECHLGKGILHRAFSIFIFNKNKQLLIQKRSKYKLLWPLYWSNSCCSHPTKNNRGIKKSAEKRLKEELGFTCPLKIIGSFIYKASYNEIGTEKEICTVLVGEYNGKIKPNPKEVADWKWISLSELKKDISTHPDKYTPWFKIELQKFKKYFKKYEG